MINEIINLCPIKFLSQTFYTLLIYMKIVVFLFADFSIKFFSQKKYQSLFQKNINSN